MENEQKKYWFFGSKLNTALLLVLIILMVIALRWMYQDKESYTLMNQSLGGEKSNLDKPTVLNEDSNQEVFKDQPGAVKSVVGWTLTVDLLSGNPNWLPGGDSEPFFLNQNSKIRTLKVTNSTKMETCQNTSLSIPVYLENIQKEIDQYNALPEQQKVERYVSYYFDIDGSTITTIREQCLP